MSEGRKSGPRAEERKDMHSVEEKSRGFLRARAGKKAKKGSLGVTGSGEGEKKMRGGERGDPV